MVAVSRNHIPCAGRRAADRVRGRTVDVNAAERVGQSGGPRRVRADGIPLHQIARRTGTQQVHAVQVVARNHVPRPHRRAADRVRRRVVSHDAVERVAQVRGPRHIGADVVPPHQIACRTGTQQVHAVLAVARNHVPFAGRRAANRVRGRTVDENAAERVGHRGGPRRVRPDVVPLHQIARRTGTLHLHAVPAVARNHIPCAGCRAADRVRGRIVDHHAVQRVARVQQSVDIDADVITLDEIPPSRLQDEPGPRKPVDGQPAHRAVAGGDRQTVDQCARRRAVQFDHGRAAKTWIRGAVDDDRVRHRRQRTRR